MQVNNVNMNFTGKLILKDPMKWTREIKRAIRNNESIQHKLIDHDVIGKISSKVADKTYANGYHRKGDTIYKVVLTAKKEPKNIFEAIRRLFGGMSEVYPVTNQYHSSYTTAKRIENLFMD